MEGCVRMIYAAVWKCERLLVFTSRSVHFERILSCAWNSDAAYSRCVLCRSAHLRGVSGK